MYNNESRTRMSQRNLVVSVVGRLVGMLVNFVGRSIFVKTLSAEYLGLGGFFGNVFAVISLCEFGFGSAICQSLYKPLAREDEYQVSAIVAYYTKIYRRVALVSLVLGVSALPLLPKIVKTTLDVNVLAAAYLLFVLHSTFSYLLAPKCNLVVCDQRMYVVTLIRCVFGIVALVVQSAMLILTGNYILYLSSRILVLVVEDLLINHYADKKYPCLALKMNVTEGYKKSLYSNVKALAFHKVGAVLSRSTDSLLLTWFVGLSGMGKYSNYALVIGTVGAFFDVAINAVGASVGNLGAGDRGKRSENVMRKLYFFNFWLLTVGTSVIASMLNPFVRLWLGENMLFTDAEMLVIVSSFYFSCIRDPVQIFVSTFGLFKESRHIPILRALCNLILSVVLVKQMGVAGVFLGTALSTLLVPLCGEVRVLYKYGFNQNPKEFYIEMFSYIFKSALIVCACFLLTYRIKFSLVGVCFRMFSSFCASNALLLVLCGSSDYFADAKGLVKDGVNRLVRLKS